MARFQLVELSTIGYSLLSKADYDNLLAAEWKYEPTAMQKTLGFDKPDCIDDVPYAMRSGATYVEYPTLNEAIDSFRKITNLAYHIGTTHAFQIKEVSPEYWANWTKPQDIQSIVIRGKKI